MLPLPAHVQHWLNTWDDVPVIVQAGMLRGEKGHDFMLSVLSRMKLEGYQFSLVNRRGRAAGGRGKTADRDCTPGD